MNPDVQDLLTTQEDLKQRLQAIECSFAKELTEILLLPAEAKQLYDIGLNRIYDLQVYRGTGNGETVFSEPIQETMFYHISREACGDSAEDNPFLKFDGFRKGNSAIVISLNTFMRDSQHEYWDGFSTNRVADRLYIEFKLEPFSNPSIENGAHHLQVVDYYEQNSQMPLIAKVFTIYDNIYYIDKNNNLNVADTLIPLNEGRASAD